MTEINAKKIPIVYKYGDTYYSSMLKGFTVDAGDALKLKLHAADVNMVELRPENTFQKLAQELAKPRTLNPITSDNSKISAAEVKLEWFWPYEMYMGASGNNSGDLLLSEGDLGDAWDSGLGEADNKAEVSIGIQAEFQQLDEIK